MVAVDGFAVFIEVVILGATLLALLLSAGYLKREGLEAPEYFALMLCSATGMMLMASANDLITIFLSLEILSIALYVLAAFDRRRLTSQEAGLKYFLLGSFSSAVFLYGIALVYGATGTTNLTGIATFLASVTLLHDGVLLLGSRSCSSASASRSRPRRSTCGRPTCTRARPRRSPRSWRRPRRRPRSRRCCASSSARSALYRVDWRPAVLGLAVLSLLVGSIAAIVQTDVKRMLAYSSIAHAGYILIAVQAATSKGTSAALFYLLTYAVMATGAFAVVMVVARKGDDRHDARRLPRLWARRGRCSPALLTLFLLAQAGVPLTGGFVAKLSVFSAAVERRPVLARADRHARPRSSPRSSTCASSSRCTHPPRAKSRPTVRAFASTRHRHRAHDRGGRDPASSA